MKTCIWGFGSSGKSAYKLIQKLGYKTFVIDKKFENEYLLPLFERIIISPGIPLNHPILKKLEENEKIITSELDLGFNYIKGKIIGITGTNGKTTTSYIIYNILKNSEKEEKVYLAGNIGEPLTKLAFRKGIFVIEISSFQLHFSKNFKPYIACITNISEDHLDSHNSFEEYMNDKLKIAKNMDKKSFLVLNYDDENLRNREFKNTNVIYVSLFKEVEGIYYREGKYYIKLGDKKEEIKDDFGQFYGEGNKYNIAFSILISYLLGVKKEKIYETIKKLSPLPHRLEAVKKENGILWINDSKSTNPHSVLFALKSFRNEGIILILGGKNKNVSFEILNKEIKEKVKKIITYGEAGEILEKYFQGIKSVKRVHTVKDAVEECKKIAEKGDVVLFSPGLSSFDQYKNYAERGEDFRKWVKEI